MLTLNEVILDRDNLDEIIAHLQRLDKGIERGIALRKLEYQDAGAKTYHEEGLEAYISWQKSGEPTITPDKPGTRDASLLEKAIAHFTKALTISEEVQDLPAIAEEASKLANMLVLSERPTEAIPLLERALTIHKAEAEQGKLYQVLCTYDGRMTYTPAIYEGAVYHDLGSLHNALYAAFRQERAQGNSEKANAYFQRLGPIRKQIANIFGMPRGEKTSPEARRVEQGEIGFSHDKPLGTDNVNDCLCVMLHDPVTKKTALAHIDAKAECKSLEEALKRLPSHGPLQARLLGARFDASGTKDAHERSRSNIRRVIGFLQDCPREINLLSACIQDPEQPTSIVVDPATFTLAEQAPVYVNPDKELDRFWAKRSDSAVRDLRVAFDLTLRSEERAPIVCSRNRVSLIHNTFFGKSEEDMYDWFSEQIGLTGHSQLGMAIEQNMQVLAAYSEALQTVQEILETKISALEEMGHTFPAEEKERARNAVKQCPLFIGADAENGNKPLISLIETELFQVTDNQITCQSQKLEQFGFPAQPYEAIEKKLRGGFQSRVREKAQALSELC